MPVVLTLPARLERLFRGEQVAVGLESGSPSEAASATPGADDAPKNTASFLTRQPRGTVSPVPAWFLARGLQSGVARALLPPRPG